jgi:hypothetical protein
MVMLRDQNAAQSHSTNFDNSSYENMESLKYLVTILANQNLFMNELKEN